MQIISRSQWGAKYASAYQNRNAPLPARQMWLHHSVTIAPNVIPPFDDDYVAIRAIEAVGQDRFGWGMSYTFLITPAGLVFEGHRINGQGSHTGGRNDIARAICLVGNYDLMLPTEIQKLRVAELLVHGYRQGWWHAPYLDGGHRDLKATACPGSHAYAAIGQMNGMAHSLIVNPPKVEEEKGQKSMEFLMRGDSLPNTYVVKIDPELKTAEGEPTTALRCYVPPTIGPALIKAMGSPIVVPQAAFDAIAKVEGSE